MACTPPSAPDAEGEVIGSGPEIVFDKSAVPPVDKTQHIVPLEEIYFDTFRRYDRIVPLTEADDGQIRNLLNAIPPIYDPKFESAEKGNAFLSDGDLVVGYAGPETAYAYPIKILNWHEIAIHDVDGVPIMVTY